MKSSKSNTTNRGIAVLLCAFFCFCCVVIQVRRDKPEDVSYAETVLGEKAIEFFESAKSYMKQNSYLVNANGNHLFLNTGDGKNEEEYIEAYSSFVSEMQKYCNDRGIGFVFELDPGKAAVYDEYYDYDDIDRKKRNLYIIDKMESKGVASVYTGSALEEAKHQVNVFGAKHDTGHWTHDGAYLAVEMVVHKLREMNGSVGIPTKDNYNIKEIYHNTISNYNIPTIEKSYEYTLKNQREIIEVTKYKGGGVKSFGSNAYRHRINPDMPDAPKLLVFGGSYMDDEHELFLPYFSEVIFIKSYFNFINYDYFISLFNPDIVIMETADYVMRNSFGSISDMKAKIHTPVYDERNDVKETTFFLPFAISKTESGGITNIQISGAGEKVIGGYIIAGDKLYDCCISISDKMTNINAAIITDEMPKEEIKLVLIGEGKKQVLEI